MTYPFKSQMAQKQPEKLPTVNHLALNYWLMVMGLSVWKSAAPSFQLLTITHFHNISIKSIYRETQTILRKVVNNEQVVNNYHKTRHLRAFSLIQVVNYG